jgi:twitching motility protein PilT
MISSTHVDDLARQMVELGGSDLPLKAGVPQAVRVQGLLTSLDGYEALRSEDTEVILQEIIPNNLVEEFEGAGEVDFSYAVPEIGRFRVNAFK